MSLIVWGRGRAANVQKVLWCLAEMGTSFEHREDGVSPSDIFSDPSVMAYLASKRPPIVPVIDDGGFVLWEGNAIVRYLAETRGTPPFWPESPQQRADASRWMDYQLSTIRGHIHPLLRENPNSEKMEGHVRKLAQGMEVLERRLEKVDYLAGNDFTAADIPLGIITYRWLLLDVPHPSFPNIEAWCRRLQSRPAFQQRVRPPLETSTPLRDAI